MIVAAALSIVGTVTGVIQVVQSFTSDATNFSHLEISAVPSTGGVSEWAVPENAMSDLPARGCDAEMLIWLQKNATPLERRLTLTMRNNASSGSMLAITELRSTGTPAAERGSLSVRFVCDPQGIVPDKIYEVRVDVDGTDAATHVELASGAESNAQAEIPLTYNLAPGESGSLPLSLFSRMPVAGSLQVTVFSGRESQVVDVAGTEFELPALLFAGDMYLITTATGPMCVQTEARIIAVCTIEDVIGELHAARR